MKAQHWLIALIVFFTCSTVVSANPTLDDLDNLTQEDGIKALEIGDALGFEVISRAELEEVRGEQYQYPAFLLNGAFKLRESMLYCTNNGFCGGAILKTVYNKMQPGTNCTYSATGHSTAAYCF